MPKSFICSLCHNGILGGGLYLDSQSVTYKTNKLTVDEKYKNLVLPLNEIKEITWKWIVIPVATFYMKNGEEYKIIIYNKARFNKYYREYSSVLSSKEVNMSEEDLRWNRFIEDICSRDMSTLSDIQRKAVLCFWYDAEMNSGGYSGYLDCYPDTNFSELKEAINSIGYKEIADNLQKAINEGEDNGWVETDAAYYEFSPSLCDCLQEFVEENKDVIFE